MLLLCLVNFSMVSHSIRYACFKVLLNIWVKAVWMQCSIKPFWPNIPFQFLLKTSENFWFSDVFRTLVFLMFSELLVFWCFQNFWFSDVFRIFGFSVLKGFSDNTVFEVVFLITRFYCRLESFETLSAIWYHLYNLKSVKNTHGGVLVVIKSNTSQ